jgi:hypothetical protein
MHVQRNVNNLVKDFLASSATDITVEWTPPYASLKKLRDMGRSVSKDTPIRIRMVKVVLETGETEVLITDVTQGTVLHAVEKRPRPDESSLLRCCPKGLIFIRGCLKRATSFFLIRQRI